MYKLYGFPLSRTSRVIWTFEEIGVDYEFINTYPHSDTAYEVNPTGKLPVLSIDGTIIIDSTAICIYLADKHTGAGLSFTQGSLERAQLDSWMQFAICDLEAPLWMISKDTFVLNENDRVPEILEQSNREWEDALGVMEKRLGNNQYAMGDQFTIADIILGKIGGRWARRREMKIASTQLNRYFERVCNRPAVSKALEHEEQLSKT